MERLEAASELQSRLSSLSFSSFPGVASEQSDSSAPDRYACCCSDSRRVVQLLVPVSRWLCSCVVMSCVFLLFFLLRLHNTDLSQSSAQPEHPADMDPTEKESGQPSEVCRI